MYKHCLFAQQMQHFFYFFFYFFGGSQGDVSFTSAHNLILESLADKLFSQLPQPLGFDRTGGPWLDCLEQGIGDVRVLEVGTVVVCNQCQ